MLKWLSFFGLSGMVQVLEVMLLTAVQRNDLESVVKATKGSVRITQKVIWFSGFTQFDAADSGLKALAEVVKVGI